MMRCDFTPREIYCPLRVTYGIDGAAEGRAREEEDRSRSEDDPHQERIRNAEQGGSRGEGAHGRGRCILR